MLCTHRAGRNGAFSLYLKLKVKFGAEFEGNSFKLKDGVQLKLNFFMILASLFSSIDNYTRNSEIWHHFYWSSGLKKVILLFRPNDSCVRVCLGSAVGCSLYL